MLKEILEAKGKWVFEKSNPGLSGAATITLGDNDADMEYNIGWNGIDKEWFGSVMGPEDMARNYDGKNGWEDRMGPQGDYSGVEFEAENLGDVINAMNKTFKVNVNKKDWQPLVNHVLGV